MKLVKSHPEVSAASAKSLEELHSFVPGLLGSIRVNDESVITGNLGQFLEIDRNAHESDYCGKLNVESELLAQQDLQKLSSENLSLTILNSQVPERILGGPSKLCWIGPLYCRGMAALFDFENGGGQIELNETFAEIDFIIEDADKLLPVVLSHGRSPINLAQLFRANFELQSRSVKSVTSLAIAIDENFVTAFEISFDFPEEIASAQVIDSAYWKIVATEGARPKHYNLNFPQADNVTRIIKLCSHFKTGTAHPVELSNRFGISPRQGNYYADALILLNLFSEVPGLANRQIRITDEGMAIANAGVEEQAKLMAESLARFPLTLLVLEMWKSENRMPTPEKVIAELKKISNLGDLSEATQIRRTQTLISWAKWVMFKK